MKSASAEYKQIMKRPMRPRGYMMVSVGVINLEAQADSQMQGSFTWYSNPNRVFSDEHSAVQYATLEQNYFKADGSMYLLPRNEISREQNAITSALLGSVTVELGQRYDIKGLTIDFGEFLVNSPILLPIPELKINAFIIYTLVSSLKLLYFLEEL